MLNIEKHRYGFHIQYNNNPLMCLCENCECHTTITNVEKVWYIYIKLSGKSYEVIKDIENQAMNIMKKHGYNFYTSLNENILQVKVPYRYKKFEAEFFDINKNRIISTDIQEYDKVNIHLKCKNVYTNNDSKQARFAWYTDLMIKH